MTFTATLRTPAGALTSIKHPEVTTATTADARSRDTGRTAATRREAVWQPDPLAGQSG